MHTSASSFSSSWSTSVRNTLKNTFWTVGGMFALTGVVSHLSLGTHLSGLMLIVLVLASFGLMFGAMALRNSGWGLVMLAGFSAVEGLIIAPVIERALSMPNGGQLVTMAIALTSAVTLACAIYASISRRDFSRFGAFLLGATVVLIVVSLVAMFFKVAALHLAIAGFTALLFTAWLLYDISAILHGRETNYISASIGIYLDILNVFLSLLRLLGISSSNDD